MLLTFFKFGRKHLHSLFTELVKIILPKRFWSIFPWCRYFLSTWKLWPTATPLSEGWDWGAALQCCSAAPRSQRAISWTPRCALTAKAASSFWTVTRDRAQRSGEETIPLCVALLTPHPNTESSFGTQHRRDIGKLEGAQGRAPRVVRGESLLTCPMRRDWGSRSGSAGKRDGFGVLNSPQHHQRVMEEMEWDFSQRYRMGGQEAVASSWNERDSGWVQGETFPMRRPLTSIPGGFQGLTGPSPELLGLMSALALWQEGRLGLSQPHLTYRLLILTSWKWGTVLNTLNEWQCRQADSSCTEPEITHCRCDGQHPTSKWQATLFFPFCLLKVFEKLLMSAWVFQIET